jgi:hypothetical protein
MALGLEELYRKIKNEWPFIQRPRYNQNGKASKEKRRRKKTEYSRFRPFDVLRARPGQGRQEAEDSMRNGGKAEEWKRREGARRTAQAKRRKHEKNGLAQRPQRRRENQPG